LTGSRNVAAVDIILPVRDAGPWVGAAIRSLRDQTLVDFRCLVTDDGSTDASAELASAAIDGDPRFELERCPARGLVATLNDMLARTDAPLVARMDADDLAAPTRLERQVSLLAADPALTVASCLVEFFADEPARVSANLRAYERWLNSAVDHDAIVRDLFVEAPLAHPSVMIRREALVAADGWREFAGPEDYDLWLRGWRAGWRFGKVPECLFRLRDHGERLTKTDPRYTPRAFLECKADHVVAAFGLAGPSEPAGRDPAGREVVVWGAGRDGKRAAKELRRRNARLAWLVDIAPTKLGRSMLGVPVRPPESLRTDPRPFVVAAVGIKGAREEIREAMVGMGYSEGTDFVCFG